MELNRRNSVRCARGVCVLLIAATSMDGFCGAALHRGRPFLGVSRSRRRLKAQAGASSAVRLVSGKRVAIDSERPEDPFAWCDRVPLETLSSVLRWQQAEIISACRATGWRSVAVQPPGRRQ